MSQEKKSLRYFFHTGLEAKSKHAVKQVWFDQMTFTELPNTTMLIFSLKKVKLNMETSIFKKSIWKEQGF